LARRHFTLQSDRPADLAEVDLSAVDPYLRTLLFTDGTVTRTLEAQSLSPVSVEVISQEQTFARGPVARHLAMSSGLGAVRRRVRIGMGEPAAPVIWAESHIVPGRLPDDFFNVLGDVGDGIGESLQQVQLESWREMLWFGFGSIPDWSGVSTASEPTAITRLYRVIVGGRPALLISEMFAVRQLAGMYHLGAFIDHTEPNSSSMS
jgi:chorismate-pyruvate lyase